MAAISSRILFFIPLFFTHIIISNDFFTPPLHQVKRFKRIIFVEDIYGKQFILKYPRSPNHALNDALGAFVGKSIGVPINDVEIFPPLEPSLSSIDAFPLQIKTLHTIVPGNEIRQMGKIIKYFSYFSIKFGLINKAKLESLTKHKDLHKIMALDIFLDNGDRHNGNLFYDKDNDHFYAIDMDALFYKKPLLATKAIRFIKRLHKKNLSSKEKTALKNLLTTLHHLILLYPPKKLCALKKKLAAKAQYTYTELEQENFKALVEYNFHEIKQLQKYLSRLLT